MLFLSVSAEPTHIPLLPYPLNWPSASSSHHTHNTNMERKGKFLISHSAGGQEGKTFGRRSTCLESWPAANGSTRKKAEALLPITYSIAQSDPTLMIGLLLPSCQREYQQRRQMDIYPHYEREGERDRPLVEPWLLYNANAGVVTNHHRPHTPPIAPHT
jgi:hypothetical protein